MRGPSQEVSFFKAARKQHAQDSVLPHERLLERYQTCGDEECNDIQYLSIANFFVHRSFRVRLLREGKAPTG